MYEFCQNFIIKTNQNIFHWIILILSSPIAIQNSNRDAWYVWLERTVCSLLMVGKTRSYHRIWIVLGYSMFRLSQASLIFPTVFRSCNWGKLYNHAEPVFFLLLRNTWHFGNNRTVNLKLLPQKCYLNKQCFFSNRLDSYKCHVRFRSHIQMRLKFSDC